MTASLERRLRQLRSRLLIRSWGYRQRLLARGVWFRLRRALADASEAYAIPVEEARALVAEGHALEPVGQDLEPPRLIVRVPAARLATVALARPLVVRLSAELLSAESLALVPFDVGEAGLPPARFGPSHPDPPRPRRSPAGT
jgi:hypothetical protein